MKVDQTVLAVDLGGTKILISEVQANGELLAPHKYRSDVTSQTTAYAGIVQAIEQFLMQAPDVKRIMAISVSAVGRINNASGEWYELDPERAVDIPLAQQLSDRFKLPVFAANDVYCATLAENMLGVGNVTNDFLYLNVGTGIAGRIVNNGQILNGSHFDAGEIGHMVVDYNSPVRCICGRRGCVEPLASGLGMSNRAQELMAQGQPTELTVDEHGRVPVPALFQGYEHQDLVAQTVVDQALRALAALIMNVVRVSDPAAVILGGGVTTDGWLLHHLQPLLVEQTMRFVTVGIHNSQLDPNLIAIKGAALHGFQRMEMFDHESIS